MRLPSHLISIRAHTRPTQIVGIILSIVSGVLIGSSFVFKKKGLLRSQAGGAAGEGVAYLKSPLWWLGMISTSSRVWFVPRRAWV